VDHFVFYDDVQYPRGRSWRNRNQIVVNGLPKWINVPVDKSAWRGLINEVSVKGPFADAHWALVEQGYRKARYFGDYSGFVRGLIYLPETNLAALTAQQTRDVAAMLGIGTETSMSSSLGIAGLAKTDRLVEICKRLGATEYVSGPSARDYIEPEKFRRAGIGLSFFEYGYPEYPQLTHTFTHYVSILDMIFNLGPATPDYIWGNR
jgi:hypothetical protein